MENSNSKNRPLAEVFENGIRIAIWSNNSRNGEFLSASVERVYKDRATGERRSSSSFARQDLLTLSEACREAYQEMGQIQRKRSGDQNRGHDQEHSHDAPLASDHEAAMREVGPNSPRSDQLSGYARRHNPRSR